MGAVRFRGDSKRKLFNKDGICLDMNSRRSADSKSVAPSRYVRPCLKFAPERVAIVMKDGLIVFLALVATIGGAVFLVDYFLRPTRFGYFAFLGVLLVAGGGVLFWKRFHKR